jgi:hypothetical protein
MSLPTSLSVVSIGGEQCGKTCCMGAALFGVFLDTGYDPSSPEPFISQWLARDGSRWYAFHLGEGCGRPESFEWKEEEEEHVRCYALLRPIVQVLVVDVSNRHSPNDLRAAFISFQKKLGRWKDVPSYFSYDLEALLVFCLFARLESQMPKEVVAMIVRCCLAQRCASEVTELCFPRVLVATKTDESWEMTREECNQLAAQFQCPLIFISPKSAPHDVREKLFGARESQLLIPSQKKSPKCEIC